MKSFWLFVLVALTVVLGAVYVIHLQTVKYVREHPELVEQAKQQAEDAGLVDK